MADLREFDVDKLSELSDRELKQICANPHIDVGQQMLAAEELTSRAIKSATKPQWIRAIFWVVSLSLMVLLLQLWWTSRYVPAPAATTAAAPTAKPAKPADTKPAARKPRRSRRTPAPAPNSEPHA